jgi:hypothetical protein
VKKRQFLLLIGVIIASTAIVLTSCKKINEATELGDDLIPIVDNITTFDTTITVEAYNGLFDLATDSQRYTRSEEQYVGRITNDPLFGGTDARMFFELKSTNYPFAFGNADPDSLTLDSVVLVLDYMETYGDTLVPQTLNVYEIAQGGPAFKPDSNYLIRENNFILGAQLGSRTLTPATLNDSVKVYLDTTKNQLRIRLDDDFGQRLLNYDSTRGPNGAYSSDSAFRSKFKGFALHSVGGGNAVMGFNLGGPNTKLAIYYKFTKNAKLDTTVHYFRFTTLSAAAQHVIRDNTFGEIAGVQGGSAPDDLVYLQNTPGSFATIKIPDIMNISNRLIHRAELIVEQVYHPTDTIFKAPDYVYLDAYDPSIALPKRQYRTIPYDVIYDGQDYNRNTFGSAPQNKLDPNGRNVKVWKFNISRYVQHLLTRTATLYDLRMYTTYTALNQYGTPPGPDVTIGVFVNPTIVKGRVRVAGGTPTSDNQRMRLRLVYSKI